MELRGHLPEGERDLPAEQPRLAFQNRQGYGKVVREGVSPKRQAKLDAARAAAASRPPYEPPVVTPAGNLHEILEEVCPPAPPKRRRR